MREPSKNKVEEVQLLRKQMESSRTIALVDFAGLDARNFQNLRRILRDKAQIRVVKNTLLEKALDGASIKKGEKLKDIMGGQIALVTTDLEPSNLYAILEANKQPTPPRGGETATDDIVIEPMDTGFPPGPMISVFQKAGLQARIEKGTIAIKKESVFVKKGEVISKEKASILQKLNIKPFTVGLTARGSLMDGVYFDKGVMSITPEKVLVDVLSAYAHARSVALNSLFFTPEILPQLLVRGRIEAEALALNSGVIDESNIQIFILKAIREALTLSATIGGGDEKSETRESGMDEKEEEPTENDSDDVESSLGQLFG